MNKDSKIYIAGHRGLVGSAILKNLKSKGYTNFITRTHSELDLTNAEQVRLFFKEEKPEYVLLAAAKVGGIVANNTYRADFLYDNLMIQNNVIHQSFENNIKKLLFLGSTCIYPKNCPQPMKEDYLLTDVLEYTNEPYAIAKIAGIKMCESYNLQYNTNYISVMPTNLYGPNDNFDLEKSHVLPALIRKVHLGKALEVDDWQIWGTGKPMREFLWSEDMADACVFLMEKIDFKDTIVNKTNEIRNTHLNIAGNIKSEIGFNGNFIFNSDKPDGTLKKLTDVSKLNKLGWKHKINLQEGIATVYEWYKKRV
ncbi:UNVERIFIED_CONTAM: hypothetical protein GTU68_026201 [Idotea baltica]|nr:hypothetical protein [Idotea baltica]